MIHSFLFVSSSDLLLTVVFANSLISTRVFLVGALAIIQTSGRPPIPEKTPHKEW